MPRASAWTFGPFEFNATTFRLEREGRLVPLEPKAQDVLRLLLERAPAVVEKSDIFAAVWKDVAVTDNALTRIVAQLRKALEDDARSPRYIETVATRGYRFVADLSESPVRVADAVVPAPAAPLETAASDVAVRAASRQARSWLWAVGALVLAAGALWALRPALTRLTTRVHVAIPVTADSRTGSVTPVVLRTAQFTTGAGVDGTPAFSYDGTAMAFSSDRSGAFEIYVQSLAPGASPAPLTHDGRHNVQPAWSPDGQFIAYHQAAGGGVWLIPSRGGSARRIADVGSRPAWSPDGRWIAVQSTAASDLLMIGSPNEYSGIVLLNPHSGEVRTLTRPHPPEGPHLAPQWASDGRIYFAEAPPPYTGSLPSATTTIWSIAADGSGRRRETSSDRILADFALAPDGAGAWATTRMMPGLTWLPFDGRPSGTMGTVSVPASGRPIQPALSRNARLLAFTGQTAASSLWSVPVGDEENPGQAEPLFLGRGLRVTGAAAAPDGTLVYSGILQGNFPQVWTRGRTGEPRQLTVDDGEHLIPFWVDGYRDVAYYATHGDVPAFHALDVSSGRERLLFRIADLPVPPGTSLHPLPNLNVLPDSGLTHVVMTLITDGVPNLWVVPLVQGRPAPRATQVTFEREGGSFPHWSPDGRSLAYQCGEGDNTHVCLVGADGSGRRQVTHEAGVHFIGGWMGTDTLLVAARHEAVWNVIGVHLTTSSVRQFTDFTDARSYVRYPQFDPSGRRILFERAQATANIWRAAMPGAAAR
ncbi:MAG: winged helix-turn-helix domain-containing protein [Vicinamibacterales bacterium]